jgi:hypothetical protein
MAREDPKPYLDSKQALAKAACGVPDENFSTIITESGMLNKLKYNITRIETSCTAAEYYSEIQLTISWVQDNVYFSPNPELKTAPPVVFKNEYMLFIRDFIASISATTINADLEKRYENYKFNGKIRIGTCFRRDLNCSEGV